MTLPRLQNYSSNQKGFTLVELLVVISIIAILSVVGVAVYAGVQDKANDSRRKEDIDSISKAMEVNFAKTTAGKYDPLVIGMFANGAIPTDPVGGADYTGVAATKAAGGVATYTICATLKGGTPSCSVTSATCYCKSSQQ